MPNPTRTIRDWPPPPREDLVTPHFRAREFDQPARHGQPHLEYPEDWVADRLRPLCEALELLRAELGGQPIRVLSGYRSEAYNVAVSGAKESQHLHGRAADIVVQGVDARRVQAVVVELYQAGRIKVGGLGRYEGFTHVDVRVADHLVIWDG